MGAAGRPRSYEATSVMHYTIDQASDIGGVIRAARKAQQLRQDDAAGSMGVSESFLGKAEAGAESVQWGKLFLILQGLGVRVSVDIPDADESLLKAQSIKAQHRAAVERFAQRSRQPRSGRFGASSSQRRRPALSVPFPQSARKRSQSCSVRQNGCSIRRRLTRARATPSHARATFSRTPRKPASKRPVKGMPADDRAHPSRLDRSPTYRHAA